MEILRKESLTHRPMVSVEADTASAVATIQMAAVAVELTIICFCAKS
jgi:hypothetical protein